MESKKYFKQKGFSLIEVLVTLSVFIVLIFGASIMLNNIFVNSNQRLLSMNNIDQARMAMATFTNEIRNATTGSDGSYPINQANDSQIVFYSNFKSGNAAIKRIRYYVSGDILYKGVVWPTGSPLTYNLSSELVNPVVAGITNGGVPAFFYYNGDYDGNGNALSQPININQVRFIKINLMVLKQTVPKDTSAFSIVAGAAIRSVKDNLGN
jgi:prepilin-type N-terminal cleavage/methylation domain-containing protein